MHVTLINFILLLYLTRAQSARIEKRLLSSIMITTFDSVFIDTAYTYCCVFSYLWSFFDLGNILQFFDTASNTLSNKRVAKTSQILHHFRFSKFLEPFVCLKFQKNLLTIYWSEGWLVSEVALIFFGLGCFWIIFSRD